MIPRKNFEVAADAFSGIGLVIQERILPLRQEILPHNENRYYRLHFHALRDFHIRRINETFSKSKAAHD